MKNNGTQAARYTEGISAKVPREVYEKAEAQAAVDGVKLSEWLRRLVTDAVGGSEKPRAEMGLVLEEVLAFRELFTVLQTLKYRDTDYPDTELQAVIAKVDGKKGALADRVREVSR